MSGDDGEFVTGVTVTATATAIHPEGTELDEYGHPIPPKDDES